MADENGIPLLNISPENARWNRLALEAAHRRRHGIPEPPALPAISAPAETQHEQLAPTQPSVAPVDLWKDIDRRYECQHCGAVHEKAALKFSGSLWCNRCDDNTDAPQEVMYATAVDRARQLAALQHHEALDKLKAERDQLRLLLEWRANDWPDLDRDTLHAEIAREVDGRYIADITAIPGVLAYGETETAAIQTARALAIHVLQGRLQQREQDRDALHTALRDFGRHRDRCSISGGVLYTCDCGLFAALAPPRNPA